MEKALHPTVAFAGLIAYLFESNLLSARDGLVELVHRIVSASFDNGPRDVAEVAGFLRARENVNDDGLVRPQNAVPLLVRVARLFATGDDGVGRQAASLNDGDVDDRA